jgi:hypothetical protein
VARGHAVTTVVKQASHQQSVRICPQCLVIGLLFAQFGLDGIEETPVEYGRLLAGHGRAKTGRKLEIESSVAMGQNAKNSR